MDSGWWLKERHAKPHLALAVGGFSSAMARAEMGSGAGRGFGRVAGACAGIVPDRWT